jgi:hypothetical protein
MEGSLSSSGCGVIKTESSSEDARIEHSYAKYENAAAGCWRLAAFLSTVLLLNAIGCSSGSSTKAGPISITAAGGTSAGQLTSLTVSGKANVSMAPVNDATGDGVDWSVYCQGSPVTGSMTGGACGALSPAHTSDGSASVYTAPSKIPLGNTVTITAAVTGDPSATSSVTLAIVATPISIAFETAPVTSLSATETAVFQVQMANDATAAGASWTATCGSTASGAACGSFSPTVTASGAQTTYTAPAAVPPGGTGGAGTVTITATSVADPTKSVSATVTILPLPVVQPITIGVSPTTLQLGQKSTASLIATVANDTTNAGVDWTVTCSSLTGACGRFTPSTGHTASGSVVTYTAPNSASGVNPVILTATATATKTTGPIQSATVNAMIAATSSISVNVTAPLSMAELQNTTLKATVTNDSSNAGVAWTVNCNTPGACGTVVSTGGSGGIYTATYTGPASIPVGGLVTVSATPNAGTPPVNPGLATITITVVPPAVAFVQKPPSSMTTSAQVPVSAVVTNDVPPGGVTWTVQCGSTVAGGCGYIQPYQTPSGIATTYTAPPVPPAGPVTIIAASTSSSSTSTSSTVTITLSTTLSIGFIPAAPTQLREASSVNLNAAVANDSSNAGVDWQVCAGGCGFFTTVPAIPAIPATAKTPYVPPVLAVTATTVQGWPNGLPIPYTAPAAPPASGAMTISASAHANSKILTVASVTITPGGTGPALQGSVQAGTLPVTGAQVGLYAAGTAGYGSASSLVSAPGEDPFTTTDQNGNFTLPSGYSCPQPASQMYLVALGGHAGTNPSNENLALMTALGSCGALSSSPVVVNEVTTIASAWALAPFAANPLNTGLTSHLNIGSSSGNAAGLANAFATVNNLVNISNGQALFTVPAGNAAVPYAEINTLADILNACAVTGGGSAGDESVCGNLFVDANPYAGQIGTLYTGIPTDTLQAAIEIAQNPTIGGVGFVTVSINGSGLFGMVSAASPFQPVLSALPYDFSLSLNFTGGGGLTSASGANFLALDASGNLWITNSGTNSVTEWNNQGAAMTPSSGYTTASLVSPGAIAIDATGNAWICDQNGLTELNFLGTELMGSPFSGGGLTASGCLNVAIDGSGNIWATNSNSVAKFDNLGDPLSPASGYTISTSPTDSDTVSVQPPIAIDSLNNVWVGVASVSTVSVSNLLLAELNNASGLPNYLSPNPQGGPSTNFVNTSGPANQTQIAVDSSGDIWVPDTRSDCYPEGVYKIPPYGGIGTTDQVSGGYIYSGSGRDPFRCSSGVAVDGGGVVWVGDAGGPSIPAVAVYTPPNLGGYNPALSMDVFGYASPSLANGPLSVAVDGSGNVWVLLNNNTVTEFVGIATPAVTPLSLAVKNKKLGAKP